MRDFRRNIRLVAILVIGGTLLVTSRFGCLDSDGPSGSPTISDDTLSGKVVAVKDGDTLVVGQTTVRLQGIDAPELGQAFGHDARQAVIDMADGEAVVVHITGHDQYGRTLGYVTLPDGRELHRELVEQGYAWWFRKYSPDKRLGASEEEARRDMRGLWADPEPTPPWEWRAAHRRSD